MFFRTLKEKKCGKKFEKEKIYASGRSSSTLVTGHSQIPPDILFGKIKSRYGKLPIKI